METDLLARTIRVWRESHVGHQAGVRYFKGLHSKLDSGSPTLLMQLELWQHLNNRSPEMKEKAVDTAQSVLVKMLPVESY